MILKILLIIMLVAPLAYLAFTLVMNIVDEVLAMGKITENKAEEKHERRKRRMFGKRRRR